LPGRRSSLLPSARSTPSSPLPLPRRCKKLESYLCEVQVLDCIARVPSKRLALLQSQLVCFKAMHSMELKALLRYAVAMTRPPQPPAAAAAAAAAGAAAGGAASAAAASGGSTPVPAAGGAAAGSSAASSGAAAAAAAAAATSTAPAGGGGGGGGGSSSYPGDGFWTAVLSLGAGVLLDSSNESPTGLTLMTVNPSAVEACGSRPALQPDAPAGALLRLAC
jgi:hypothetical protein